MPVKTGTRPQTGIYRQFREGKLYFVREITEDFDTHVLRVIFDRLYPVCRGTKIAQDARLGFFQSIATRDEKGDPVSRFTLVQALPAKAIGIISLGSVVRPKKERAPLYVVHSISEQNNSILVILFRKEERQDISLSHSLYCKEFLETFEGAE